MITWLTGSDTQRPLYLDFRSSNTFIISTIAIAIFTDIFVYSVVVPVLPFALTTRAGIAPDSIQTWVAILLAIYGAAIVVAAPFCGWLADRTASRRFPLILGLLALGGSTVMLCVGNSIALFAVGRVVGGISAAVVWTVGLALMVDTVGGENIGQAMGIVGSALSVAVLLGPLLGGVVFAASGYYQTYAMGFGLIIVDILMRIFMIEKKVAKKWLAGEVMAESPTDGSPRIEESKDCEAQSRSQTLEAAVEKPVTPIIQLSASRSPRDGETDTSTTSPPSSTSKQATKRTIRLPPVITLLGSRRLLSALFGCLVQASLMTAFDSILPLFVHATFHWTSLGAGLIFLPLAIASFLGPLVGHLSDIWGPRWLATAGFLGSCPCLILLRLVDGDTLRQKVLLCALLALIGLGLTLSVVPLMAEITYAVDAKARRRPVGYFGSHGVYAQAYGLFNVAWAAGCMVGPLLAGLVNQRAGWKVTTLMLGCVSVVTAVPVAVWTGGSIWKARREKKGDDGRA